MKFIRTKDGEIHDFLGKYKDEFGFYYLDTNKEDKYRCDNDYYKNCKEADTIEELCDEFVLHYGDTMQTSISIPWATYERRDDNWQKHKEKLISELKKTERKAIVYGAIWTDKGLIYVAKMNNKGELELL